MGTTKTISRAFVAAGVAAVVIGVVSAASRAWVCDDAFISFRYAAQWVHGHGLVFNPGERVEGFSNPLWTVWMAAGFALGRDLETWSIGWGLAFHAGTIALLVATSARVARAAPAMALPLPFAALVAAVHPDWAIHATSGLETSAYTFFVFAGWFALTRPGAGRPILAGAVFALAALTRPDGILFAALGAAYVLARGERRGLSLLVFGGAFASLWAPSTLARVAYYGAYLPNTYYAKSAGRSWFAQGALYESLYFQRYWPLLVGFVAGAVMAAVAVRRAFRSVTVADADAVPDTAHAERDVFGAVAFAAVAALVYLVYVARVGGDFMYARMMIPATPLLLVVGEFALARIPARPAIRSLVAASVLGVTALMPSPVTGSEWVAGIADEWAYYVEVRPELAEGGRRAGLTLRRYFAGLPIGMAFFGGEARLVYYAEPAIAVESEAGLTDAFVAHRPLAARGRIGHEKHATADYLLRTRGLLVAFHPALGATVGLDARIPDVPIVFDGIEGRLLRWDPSLLAQLAARGARFPDVPAQIDAYLRRSDEVPRAQRRADYARYRAFYFAHVDDPVREQAFLAACGRP